MKINNETFPALSNKINWGIVESEFQLTHNIDEIDQSLVSNVSIIPHVDDKYVIFQVENGDWELPGGTLEVNEDFYDALKREVMEELGAKLISYDIFGHFFCTSNADKPYKPHIPHPNFVRLVGHGEVKIIGKPLNPPDGELVISVELVEIEEAIKIFKNENRNDIAELYMLAHRLRNE